MLHDIAWLLPAITAILNLVRVIIERLPLGSKIKTRRRKRRSSRLAIDLGWLKYVRKAEYESDRAERRD